MVFDNDIGGLAPRRCSIEGPENFELIVLIGNGELWGRTKAFTESGNLFYLLSDAQADVRSVGNMHVEVFTPDGTGNGIYKTRRI